MIAKLTGNIDLVGEDHLIMDVQGVGYLVFASSRTLDALRASDQAVSLWIETQVREDAITLYGFKDRADQSLFKLLTSVQGVGAKVGLAIQSVMDGAGIETAIAAQDKAAVARANGVGPKLAARIVNELKDKVAGLALGSAAGVASATTGTAPVAGGSDSRLADVTSALVNLGYGPSDAHGAAARALAKSGEGATIGSLIPLALKELAQ